MREWLMRLVAGRKVYWLSEDAAEQFRSLNGLVGAGAAIALVDAVRKVGAARADYTLDGWTVTVAKRDEE